MSGKVHLHKAFDPAVGMGPPGRLATGPRSRMEQHIAHDIEYAAMLCQGDVDGRVTANTDATGDTTFLVWHMADGTHQVDTFTITEESA